MLVQVVRCEKFVKLSRIRITIQPTLSMISLSYLYVFRFGFSYLMVCRLDLNIRDYIYSWKNHLNKQKNLHPFNFQIKQFLIINTAVSVWCIQLTVFSIIFFSKFCIQAYTLMFTTTTIGFDKRLIRHHVYSYHIY